MKVALVVDDLQSVRGYIADVLREDGFEVLEASNGADALSLVRSLHGRLDVVISDVQMPGGDGYSLARALSASFPSVPILLTSSEAPSLRGVNAKFMQKPFTAALLQETIRAMCRSGEAG